MSVKPHVFQILSGIRGNKLVSITAEITSPDVMKPQRSLAKEKTFKSAGCLISSK